MEPGTHDMSKDELLVRYVYIPLAALMGAVSSLGARKWRQMNRAQIIMTLIMGTTSAIFLTPWVAHKFFDVREDDARAIVALTYLFGFGAFIFLPKLTEWMGKVFGAGESQ